MSTLDARIENLSPLMHQALSHAQEQGADAKVGLSLTRNTNLVMETGELSLAQTIEQQGLSLVLHKDQRKASTSTNSASAKAIKPWVEQALSIAKFSVNDPYLNFPDKTLGAKAHSLNFLYNASLEQIDFEELRELMQGLKELYMRDPRICVERFELGISSSYNALKNTHGVDQAEEQSAIYWSLGGLAREGDKVGGMDYLSGMAFNLEDFRVQIMADIEESREWLLESIQPITPPSYEGAVLFSPAAFNEIFLNTLLYHCAGRQVMDGKSKFIESINQAVASPSLTLRDDPHHNRLAGATSFNGDGIATKKLNILEKGILKLHLHDAYSAKKTGASLGATTGAPHGLCVEAGDHKLETLKTKAEKLLYVGRFAGNIDPLTGAYSGVVKGGRLYEKGQSQGAVAETMIAGNVFEGLNQIIGLSAERKYSDSQALLPFALIDRVKVSAG